MPRQEFSVNVAVLLRKIKLAQVVKIMKRVNTYSK